MIVLNMYIFNRTFGLDRKYYDVTFKNTPLHHLNHFLKPPRSIQHTITNYYKPMTREFHKANDKQQSLENILSVVDRVPIEPKVMNNILSFANRYGFQLFGKTKLLNQYSEPTDIYMLFKGDINKFVNTGEYKAWVHGSKDIDSAVVTYVDQYGKLVGFNAFTPIIENTNVFTFPYYRGKRQAIFGNRIANFSGKSAFMFEKHADKIGAHIDSLDISPVPYKGLGDIAHKLKIAFSYALGLEGKHIAHTRASAYDYNIGFGNIPMPGENNFNNFRKSIMMYTPQHVLDIIHPRLKDDFIFFKENFFKILNSENK